MNRNCPIFIYHIANVALLGAENLNRIVYDRIRETTC